MSKNLCLYFFWLMTGINNFYSVLVIFDINLLILISLNEHNQYLIKIFTKCIPVLIFQMTYWR
jgi:hypothetical protein